MSAAAVVVPIVPTIKLSRILYATDFSEGSHRALPVVAALAHRYGSCVLLAHIRSSPASSGLRAMDKMKEREAAQEEEEKLGKIARRMVAWGVSAITVVRSGEPVDELEQIARDHEIELAILSTHGRVGAERILMGSVAEELFRNLPCPVLTVGPHLAPRFGGEVEIKKILFATDLSEESRAVFPYLASLAHEYKAKITLLHVLPPETGKNPDAGRLSAPLRKEMERIFDPEISPECETEFLIASGDPTEQILKAARAADLIGFGIRKAGGMTTHFHNTLVYRVLVAAECPVLTCRQYSDALEVQPVGMSEVYKETASVLPI